MASFKRRLFLPALLFLSASLPFQQAAAAGDPKEGKKIFDSICSSCHGENGVTETPGIPVFANGERMEKKDAELKASVKNGVNNPNNPAGMSMPPFGGGPALNDGQIEDVISYIRTLKK